MARTKGSSKGLSGNYNHRHGGEDSDRERSNIVSIFKGYVRMMDVLGVDVIARPSIGGAMVDVTRRQCANIIHYIENPTEPPLEWAVLTDGEFDIKSKHQRGIPSVFMRGPKGGKGYYFDKRPNVQRWRVAIRVGGVNGRHIDGGYKENELDARVCAGRIREQEGLFSAKSFCKYGHALTRSNTRSDFDKRTGKSYPTCIECNNRKSRESRAKRGGRPGMRAEKEKAASTREGAVGAASLGEEPLASGR